MKAGTDQTGPSERRSAPTGDELTERPLAHEEPRFVVVWAFANSDGAGLAIAVGGFALECCQGQTRASAAKSKGQMGLSLEMFRSDPKVAPGSNCSLDDEVGLDEGPTFRLPPESAF